MYHKKSFYYSSAHNAWLSVIAIKTGKQHQISLELEKQDFWQVPAAAATAAASATSAARLRLVLTSCRQGRLTGLGLLTLQKRWSTKLQSHLKNSNNVKTASQKYLHKLFIPIKINIYWVIFWRCEENQNYSFHLLDLFCLKILQRILEELKFLIWKPW